MEAAVREFDLGLDAQGSRDTPAIELIRKVVEQGTLPDAGLAANHDDPAATVEGVGHCGVQKFAFVMSSKQPHSQIAYLGRLGPNPIPASQVPS